MTSLQKINSSIVLTLPWPPTSNTYWRRRGHCYFISDKGQRFREFVAKQCYGCSGIFSESSRLRISISAYPPDKRKRDLDNLFKAVLDSLQAAGLYPDDSQIDELSIKRMPTRDGKIVINLESIS